MEFFICIRNKFISNYLQPEEKFKAQGFNDLVVFSFTAISSLSAGILISMTSWKSVNLLCIPFLILIILSVLNADRKKIENNFSALLRLITLSAQSEEF